MSPRPKILIISHNVLNTVSNNGKTILSFFKGSEMYSLAQIYFLPEKSDVKKTDIDFFRVTDKNILKSIVYKNIFIDGRGINKRETIPTKKYQDSAIISLLYLIKSNFPYISALIRDLLWKSRIWDSPKLRIWIKEVDPRLIFFVGGFNTFPYEVLYEIRKIKKVPYIIYYTDDYILPRLSISPFWWLQRYRVRSRFQKALNYSSANLVIGEIMQTAYENKFRYRFSPIMNIAENNPFDKTSENKRNDRILSLSYFGNLEPNRWKSLVKLSEVIDRINNNIDKKIELNIFSLEKPKSKFLKYINNRPFVKFRGSINDKLQLYNKLNESHIVVHVESFSLSDKNITRYSISTKLSEYLTFGKCILAYGPKDIASMQFLTKNDIALVCNNESQLYDTLNNVLINTSKIVEYGLLGKNYARTQANQGRIHNLINNVIAGKKYV